MAKLCKELCKRCWNEHGSKVNKYSFTPGCRWTETDEQYWSKGVVYCPSKYHPHLGPCTAVNCEPDGVPDYCFYRFEQIVLSGGNTND